MSFQEAVEAIPALANCFQPGMQALGSNSNKITVGHTRELCGSVDLDECLEKEYPDEPRWDYLLCYKQKVYCIEVHPADEGAVKELIAKKQWLANWFKADGATLAPNKMETAPYYWVASGRVSISPNSKQRKQLAQQGISFPQKHLRF